ncbi:MAG: hypothetical protein R2826_04245 [Thermoleophilia bacterium]
MTHDAPECVAKQCSPAALRRVEQLLGREGVASPCGTGRTGRGALAAADALLFMTHDLTAEPSSRHCSVGWKAAH